MSTDSREALYAIGAYTKLDLATMILIFSYYRLNESEVYLSHKELKGGLSNSNYTLVTNQRTLLCKICDNKQLDELRGQIKALLILRQQQSHLKIAAPIIRQILPTNDSNTIMDISDHYLLCLPNLRPIIMYEYLDGIPPSHPSKSLMQQLAHSLTLLHSIDAGLYCPFLPPFPMGYTEMHLLLDELPHLPLSIQQHPFIMFLTTTLNQLLPTIKHPSLSDAILHGDLFLENCIIRPNTKSSGDSDDFVLLGIIDWEEMCLGPALLDIAMTIVGCCYDELDQLNHSLTHAFISSYHQFKPFSKIDQLLLCDFIVYACLSIGFWRFRQFNIRSPNEQRKDSYQSMRRRIETLDRAWFKHITDNL